MSAILDAIPKGSYPDLSHPHCRDLVGWWPFLGIDGDHLIDVGPNRKHGTLNNMDAADWISSPYGQALDFDGSNDHVDIPYTDYCGDKVFTVMCWAAWTHNVFNEDIFGFSNSSSTSNVACVGSSQDNVQAAYRTGSSGNTKYTGSTTGLNDGVFRHICLVSDGTNSFLYLNGRQDGTAAVPTGTLTTDRIYIGRSGASSYTACQVREARIYDRALSEAEAMAICIDPWAPFRRSIAKVFDVGGGAVTVTPDPLAIATSIPAPTTSLVNEPSSLAIASSIPAASTAIETSVSPLATAISIPSVTTQIEPAPSPLAIATSIPAPATDLVNTPDPIAITISTPTPVVGGAVQVAPLSLSVSVAVPATKIDPSPAPLVVDMSLPAPSTQLIHSPSPLGVTIAIAAPSIVGTTEDVIRIGSIYGETSKIDAIYGESSSISSLYGETSKIDSIYGELTPDP